MPLKVRVKFCSHFKIQNNASSLEYLHLSEGNCSIKKQFQQTMSECSFTLSGQAFQLSDNDKPHFLQCSKPCNHFLSSVKGVTDGKGRKIPIDYCMWWCWVPFYFIFLFTGENLLKGKFILSGKISIYSLRKMPPPNKRRRKKPVREGGRHYSLWYSHWQVVHIQ